MIDEKTAELLVERFIRRIEQANTYFLMKIGSSIKKIRDLKPSEAQKLVQILKYDGTYEEIIKEISKYTGLNVKEIDEIFSNYAKKDQLFYEKFYKYRDIPFTPFEQNSALLMQTMALSNIAKREIYNFTRPSVLGYTIRDEKGIPRFYGLKETYNRVLNEALLNVGQGKETFDSAMTRIMKDIGGSGLKTIEFASGRSMRLDSAVRMHIQDALRLLHNENQKIIGEEFDYDGIEVTHHANAAPDHIDTIDGKQFALVDIIKEHIEKGIPTEVDKIRGYQVWVDGKVYDDFNAVNNALQRPVSTLNCKHKTFTIILGVSKPEYTQEQLDEDKKKNLDGFEFEGKHYSMYEGTQLQRMLERRIREEKDIQTLAKTSGNEFLAGESQHKITMLTHKYKELSDVSGLPTKAQRLRVSTYKRSANASKVYQNEINKYKVGNFDITKYDDKIKPTTNEVVFMPDRIEKNNIRHPKDIVYYEKIPEILNNPDRVYKEIGKNKNTYWLTKEIDGNNIQTIVKINTTSLYQSKELGYKNSIIHLHRIRNGYEQGKIKKGEIKLLFDNKSKK